MALIILLGVVELLTLVALTLLVVKVKRMQQYLVATANLASGIVETLGSIVGLVKDMTKDVK